MKLYIDARTRETLEIAAWGRSQGFEFGYGIDKFFSDNGVRGVFYIEVPDNLTSMLLLKWGNHRKILPDDYVYVSTKVGSELMPYISTES